MRSKRSFIFVVILLVLLPVVFAQSNLVNDFNDYSSININFRLDTQFDLTSSIDNSRVSEANAFLTFFPQNDTLQTVKNFEIFSNPIAEITLGDEIVYKWTNPSVSKFDFGVNSEITTNNALVIIDKKINFPIEDVTSNYLKATEFIDITPEIKAKADELASGEDDLYVVAFKIGNWVKENVNYNLSSLTADVVEKSSWVFKNRQGVCDELTNLFISMMRSQGIPARFVSGLAYTNIGHTWGSHGWAEVYFPDKGWVPFDVTYGQFGWIDPGHIKLKQSADSGEAAIRYTWKSNNGKIEDKQVNLNASLISAGDKISSPLDFSIKSLVNNVGPGSFVPIMIEVKNRNEYYFPDTFFVTKATNLTEGNFKSSLLKPGESKRIFWITKLPDYAKDNYVYTSSIEIEDQFHKKVNTNLTYSKSLNVLSLEQANNLISKNKFKEELITISKSLTLNCDAPSTAFTYETFKVNCIIKNKDSQTLNEINVCLKQECKNINLNPNEEKQLDFLIKLELGAQSFVVNAKIDNIIASDVHNIEILENPGLEISNTVYPINVGYSDNFNFIIILTSKVPVKDVQININNNPVMKLDSVTETRQIIISTGGRDLYNSDGRIKITLDYKDLNDKEYTVNSDYPLNIINVPWYVKLFSFFGLN